VSDTIFALSSGAPPAGIGVVRVSGPGAGGALEALAGRIPPARHASMARLRAGDGALLDEALVLWFPGPNTATGEDLAEFHLHGGRAVVAAVERELGTLDRLRKAEPGEFTRRAFLNGRIDLAEAEGLAELLASETELQRRAAMQMAGGAFSEIVSDWRDRVLGLSAQLEAVLDFSDEDDVAEMPSSFQAELAKLAGELEQWLLRPRAERLHDGFRVVIAGPPNAGKSTLFNALVENEAAITSPTAGTTRDVLERSVALAGVPFTFVDTAGLRADSSDEIETIGIGRAEQQMSAADLVLWLGPEGEGPAGALEVDARCDEAGHMAKIAPDLVLSAVSGAGMDDLRARLLERARSALPKPGEMALNARQATLVERAHLALAEAQAQLDLLLVGEGLREARLAFDQLVGRASTEDMLDALFGRFCIGK
jgi:tRNA modification GTPase